MKTTNAQIFDQDNLIEIGRMDFVSNLETYFSHHYYMSIDINDVYESADVKGTYRKFGEKYLSVSHYIPKDGGGLKVVYKVDKEIWAHLQSLKRFQK